jgi:4-hydroxyphenylacetate 3-monooxygenase
MIRTGSDYLESIRDGREIYVGAERIGDQTAHPAFADGARTYAALYDMKADPANRDVMTVEENGERYSTYYLPPKTPADLVRRNRAHRRITEFCYGVMGRTPDAVAGNITGLAMKSEVFDSEEGGYRRNLLAIYEHMRKDDIFATYAVVPPPGARSRDYYQSSGVAIPACRVTRETDAGVVVNGMKMLATGAAYAHEVLVGNIMPLAPDQKSESITCVIPLSLPGLRLVSRPPFNRAGMRDFDGPLTRRFDESDCMLVFTDALVPWEKVIVHNNAPLSRNIYVQTPAHVIANHQSTVRFHTKLRFLVGVASLVTRHTGARDIPAVRETLARLAAMEAGYGAMVDAQVLAPETLEPGITVYNRRYLYAALHWAMENHSSLLDIVRELMGGGQFQFPATIAMTDDPDLKALFDTYWAAGPHSAVERMKLFKLAWDLVGSEHASRAASYEKFFVGPAHALRNYNFVNAPWDELHAIAEGLMASYEP